MQNEVQSLSSAINVYSDELSITKKKKSLIRYKPNDPARLQMLRHGTAKSLQRLPYLHETSGTLEDIRPSGRGLVEPSQKVGGILGVEGAGRRRKQARASDRQTREDPSRLVRPGGRADGVRQREQIKK